MSFVHHLSPGSSFNFRRALSALALGAALLAPAVQAQAAWAPTGTKAIGLRNATLIGQAPDDMPLHLLVGLQMRNRAQAEAMLKQIVTPGSPMYGNWLKTGQFDQQFAPTATQVQSVVQYLKGAGFSKVEASADGLYIKADGSAAVAQNAFNTVLARYQFQGKTVFTNTSDAQVPEALAGIVQSVVGLQSAGIMRSTLVKTKLPESGTQGTDADTTRLLTELTPADFAAVYNVGDVPEASNTTIAIFAEGDLTQVPLDLAQFRTEQKLDPVDIQIVPTGLANPDTSGLDEFDLDTQTSTGMAGNVKQLIVYDNTSLTDVDLIPGFDRFATDNLAQAGSASFSGCEVLEILTGAITTYDQIFLKSVLQGQTIFSSSGDDGAFCGLFVATGVPDTGLPFQGYPCTSTYVMCVGGTTVVTDTEEISWIAGGGGLSVIESPGFWTYGIQPLASVTVPNNPVILSGATIPLYKGVPDVAMDGDAQLSPAAVVVEGADTGVGGTSLSSPLALGAWARLQSTHYNQLGFAGTALYPMASGLFKAATGFRDIILGTNGEFFATPGWDYNTGLGTFDISALNAALPVIAPPAPSASKSGVLGGSPGRFGGALGFGFLGMLSAAAALRRKLRTR